MNSLSLAFKKLFKIRFSLCNFGRLYTFLLISLFVLFCLSLRIIINMFVLFLCGYILSLLFLIDTLNSSNWIIFQTFRRTDTMAISIAHFPIATLLAALSLSGYHVKFF